MTWKCFCTKRICACSCQIPGVLSNQKRLNTTYGLRFIFFQDTKIVWILYLIQWLLASSLPFSEKTFFLLFSESRLRKISICTVSWGGVICLRTLLIVLLSGESEFLWHLWSEFSFYFVCPNLYFIRLCMSNFQATSCSNMPQGQS